MKKFLSIFGGIFIFFVLVAAGFIGYAAYKGPELDALSKAYVEANIPLIISTWSKDELLKRASPELLEIVKEKPELLDQLFQKLSKLGALQNIGDVKGDSSVLLTVQGGMVTRASYEAKAKFENGDALISVHLIQLSGQWKILNFNVNSPLFLQ